jgi:hypothetical protein
MATRTALLTAGDMCLSNRVVLQYVALKNSEKVHGDEEVHRMAADQIIYCLERITDYTRFECLCHDVMRSIGFSGIEPLGRFHDRGRDAIHRAVRESRTTLFAYSVRDDWRQKLREDARKIHRHGHECNDLYFATTADIDAPSRDEMIGLIDNDYGWHLELFGADRLRAEIASDLERFVSLHPQIFTPSLFPFSAGGFDLSVRVSPTRHRHTQLAQIVLFNRGGKPIFVNTWYAYWGGEPDTPLVDSLNCWRGSLPHRLNVQEQYEILVALDRAPIQSLTEIGVRDGNRRKWAADDENIRSFLRTAKRYELPRPEPRVPEEVLAKCEVEIDVVAEQGSGRTAPILQAIFRNNSSLPIEVAGAEVLWEYDPPEPMGSEEPADGPRAYEVSGSVSLRRQGQAVVQPASRVLFYLPRDMAPILIDALRPTVVTSSIAVTVGTTTRVAWTATGDDVAQAVRDVATGTLRDWDESP